MKKRLSLIKNLASKYFYEKTNNREAQHLHHREQESFSQTQKKREKLLDEAEKRTKLNKKSDY